MSNSKISKPGLRAKFIVDDYRLYLGFNLTLFSKLIGKSVVGVILLSYLIFVTSKMKQILVDTVISTTIQYLVIFLMFTVFAALLVGVVLFGNELGKAIGFNADQKKFRKSVGGIGLVIFAFILSYIVNIFILQPNQSNSIVPFSSINFPWIFHLWLVIFIAYVGLGITSTFLEIEINKMENRVTLFRKASLTQKPVRFEFPLDQIHGILITGTANQPVDKKTLFLYLYLLDNNNLVIPIKATNGYFFGHNPKKMLEFIQGICKITSLPFFTPNWDENPKLKPVDCSIFNNLTSKDFTAVLSN